MNIGIDLSPLQGTHRMRGIGSVIVNFINNLSDVDKKKHVFIFFMEPVEETQQTALKLLNLEGLNYKIRSKPIIANTKNFRLPGKLRLISKLLKKSNTMFRFWLGETGYDCNDLDAYLLTDQVQSMPRAHRKVKKVMIAYDLIPYVIEWDYLRSYKTIRRLGLSRKVALASELQRYIYITKIRINTRKSHKILAISKQTRQDFIKYAHVSKNKIVTVYLGVNKPEPNVAQRIPNKKFVSTSWGYMPRSFTFDTNTPFLLFVGGTDARRKLNDLVTAFNHLRAQGNKLKLVLSGDILQGPNNLPVEESRKALLESSYADDIIFLGFTDEEVKNWLYKHALAFIYPSRYEGFGLPVLEAMSYGTPVVTYNNSSISEIAGSAAIYASDALSVADAVETLIQSPESAKQRAGFGLAQSSKFTWSQTARNIINEISS